jgi:ribosome-associated protein
MDEDLVIRGSVRIPASELSWRFSRASGPGGQSVNTTDSRVQLSFDLARTRSLSPFLQERALERLGPQLVDGCVVVGAAEHRSQRQNRRAAQLRLVAMLQAAIAPPPRPRRATRPTKGSVERRLRAKQARGETKRLRRSAESD